MSDLIWTTEKRLVKELVPYNHNPRKIDKKQQNDLKKSLEKFGLVEIPAINKDNCLIAGHQRTMIMLMLGKGDELIDVRVPNRQLTEDELKEYNVRSNKNTGSWDYDVLKEFFDLDLLIDCGFDKKELEFNFKPEDIEQSTVPEESICENAGDVKINDIWKLGDHILMCGDSTDINAVEKLIGENIWDTLIFDPPYEVEDLYKTAMLPFQKGKRLLTFWDFKRFAIAGKCSIDFGWTPQYEFIWDCITSWYTPNRPLARHKACGYFSEDPYFNFESAIIKDGKERKAGIVHNTRGACDYKPLDGAVHIRTVEAFPNASEGDVHKHGKPVEWIKAIFNGIGGNIYLDLFGGGGTTICVCELLGKRCLTMELNPVSCNAIISRWEKMTNKKAELLNNV